MFVSNLGGHSLSAHEVFLFTYYSFFNKLIYLFLVVLGLHCCVWAFSSCGEQGLLFLEVSGLLIAVASHCGAQVVGVWALVVVACRLNSCGSQALEHRLSSCGARA